VKEWKYDHSASVRVSLIYDKKKMFEKETLFTGESESVPEKERSGRRKG